MLMHFLYILTSSFFFAKLSTNMKICNEKKYDLKHVPQAMNGTNPKIFSQDASLDLLSVKSVLYRYKRVHRIVKVHLLSPVY